MTKPFAHVRHLILATSRKAYPFLVLSVGGVRAYFVTRADAEGFVKTEGGG